MDFYQRTDFCLSPCFWYLWFHFYSWCCCVWLEAPQAKLVRMLPPCKRFSWFSWNTHSDFCRCESSKRFHPFRDPLIGDSGMPLGHVRTMDTKTIRNPCLRLTLKNGLNHIPLKANYSPRNGEVLMDAWSQVSVCMTFLSPQYFLMKWPNGLLRKPGGILS